MKQFGFFDFFIVICLILSVVGYATDNLRLLTFWMGLAIFNHISNLKKERKE